MKRNEACEILTRIATNELMDILVCKELLKTRDIVVCKQNKILDVLANEDTQEIYRKQTREYLYKLLGTNMLSHDVAKEINALIIALINGFDDGCDKKFRHERCVNCPNYRGE